LIIAVPLLMNSQTKLPVIDPVMLKIEPAACE